MSRYIVTTAPPNPNGDLHLGHLAGPFLGADVQARFLRGRGDEVTHVGYIDEHSCYVTRRARELSSTPHITAHRLGNRIEATLAMAAMSPDFMGRPHRDAWHDEVVQEQFMELWSNEYLTVEECPVYYCPGEEQYLYEAEVRGLCHHCLAPSDGFYCEECGKPQESARLVDPKCTTCWAPPEIRAHRRIVFDLDKWRFPLAAYYAQLETRPRLRQYLDMMLRQPLPATPVSRIGGYGIPVPLPGWEGHYLDTWFSGVWGYMAATEGARRVVHLGDGLPGWADEGTQILEFFGFDCSFSHAILWCAFALASRRLVPPAQINTNEFYTLEGGKFSTSRGHAIWGADILAQVPVDSLRFYLCLTGPELEQTNFTMAEFTETTRVVLVDQLERVVRRIAKPTTEQDVNAHDEEELLDFTAQLADRVARALDPGNFSPRTATQAIADYAGRLADANSVHLLRCSQTVSDRLLELIAGAVAPIMPAWADDLGRAARRSGPSIDSAAGSAGRAGWTITREDRTWQVRSLALSE